MTFPGRPSPITEDLVDSNPLRLEERMEMLETLNWVMDSPHGGIVALFGRCPVWLPDELGPRLRPLVGKKVGILCLSGFHVVDLDGEAHA